MWILINVLLGGLAILGLFRLWRVNRVATGLLLTLIVVFSFGWTTVEGSPTTRILMPLIPLIALAAASGLAGTMPPPKAR